MSSSRQHIHLSTAASLRALPLLAPSSLYAPLRALLSLAHPSLNTGLSVLPFSPPAHVFLSGICGPLSPSMYPSSSASAHPSLHTCLTLPIHQGPRISLENFERPEHADRAEVMTSPRSLRACFNVGVRPAELVPLPSWAFDAEACVDTEAHPFSSDAAYAVSASAVTQTLRYKSSEVIQTLRYLSHVIEQRLVTCLGTLCWSF